MKNANRYYWISSWLICGVLAALGLLVIFIGFYESTLGLIFGGLVMMALAALCLLQARENSSDSERMPISRAEKAAWTAINFCVAALLVLGQMAAGVFKLGISAYMIVAVYGAVILFYPIYRRMWLEKDLRLREVLEDERDLVIRAHGEHWAKRAMEFVFVTIAVIFVAFPQILEEVRDPLQIASLLLISVLCANAAGEVRMVVLHRRDRQ